MLMRIKSLVVIQRFFVKRYIVLGCMSFFFHSYSMDRSVTQQPVQKKIIILNKQDVAYICCYIENSSISVDQKRFLINGLKPKKSRRV